MGNNKYKILLVEDEDNIRKLVSTMLETSGYQVLMAQTCELAQIMYSSYVPDLILLDLGLPDKDGIYFLKEVRKESPVPVIILSARTEEHDIVEALDMGANDYITKPFGSSELLARVRAALRNSHQMYAANIENEKFVLNDMVIDYSARQVFIKGEEVKLTQTEYNIVSLLSEHCGKMMTYSAIIKGIWGYPDEGSIKKLQVNMANIRKKLGAKPGVRGYIINELGVGYRMNSEKA